jgi:hypothetical protein
MKYAKSEVLSLKNSSDYSEKWVQERIAEDPLILGLGEVVLKDYERNQLSGGRLDLLLYDSERNIRYEVEIMLGETDPSHIIRTIEYWDNERKRFPQYEHCAVIIAEEITGRFLNVISLFNGHIPIIAIQMKALKIEDTVSLFFTKVVDIIRYGTEEDDAEKEITDRKYWENLGSKNSLELADEILKISNTVAPGYQLKYNKYYIGLNKDGVSNNFISIIPKKHNTILSVKLIKGKEFDDFLGASDFDLLSYDNQWNQYRIRITDEDIKLRNDKLKFLIEKAYKQYKGE